MKTLSMSHDLWDLVENGFSDFEFQDVRLTAAQRTELKENKKKDAKALFYIQSALDETIFPRILGAEKPKEAWDMLKNGFQGSKEVITVRNQSLRREFETLVMKIRPYGSRMTDQTIFEKTLISLLSK